MKKLSAILCLMLFSTLANASPKHLFWCGILSKNPQQQVYVEATDEDLANGVGLVMLSNMAPAGWQIFLSVKTKVSLTWGDARDGKGIIAADIDLGRSGHITAKTTTSYDQYNSAPGTISANVMGFNYPNSVQADYCSYFRATGPKPGLSGSN